jgi:hypothetical protein
LGKSCQQAGLRQCTGGRPVVWVRGRRPFRRRFGNPTRPRRRRGWCPN